MGALKDAWANYRDESFIEQFLSPKLMRDFRLFSLFDKADEGTYRVSSIHNESGYRAVRAALARQYDVGVADPNIQVIGRGSQRQPHAVSSNTACIAAFRFMRQRRKLVVQHIERLWGHDVALVEVDDGA